MALMWPIAGVTIAPQRPTYDGLGNITSWTALNTIDNAVLIPDQPAQMYTERGTVYGQTGTLYVPKGSGLSNGDRVTYQNRQWEVIGEAEWNMNHPMTGDDFGYITYPVNWTG